MQEQCLSAEWEEHYLAVEMRLVVLETRKVAPRLGSAEEMDVLMRVGKTQTRQTSKSRLHRALDAVQQAHAVVRALVHC